MHLKHASYKHEVDTTPPQWEQRDRAIAEVDRLRADLAKAQGLIDFLNQPLPVNSRTALIERCYQVQLICETIPAHENQTKTALALSDLIDAIRKAGGRDETLADLLAARADAERATVRYAELKRQIEVDNWSAEMQRALDFIPGQFVGNDAWENGVKRLADAWAALTAVLDLRPEAMEAHVEAMADALMPYLDDDQIPASAARAAVAALLRARR